MKKLLLPLLFIASLGVAQTNISSYQTITALDEGTRDTIGIPYEAFDLDENTSFVDSRETVLFKVNFDTTVTVDYVDVVLNSDYTTGPAGNGGFYGQVEARLRFKKNGIKSWIDSEYDVVQGSNSFRIQMWGNNVITLTEIGIQLTSVTGDLDVAEIQVYGFRDGGPITGLSLVENTDRTLLKVYDMSGTEVSKDTKNTLIIYRYSDGTSEKIYNY